VTISHPEKVLFPDAGITKGELAGYYELVAPLMLPHICRRPITLERYHRGIEEQGFFQKNLGKGAPDWLDRVEVPKREGVVRHSLVCDVRSLLWLANQNCITPHVWTSRTPDLYRPDICVFDLDPSKDEPSVLRDAALAVRDLLHDLGLPSWVKTTGSKGFHIVVPLDGEAGFEEVARFAHAVAKVLVMRDPEHLTQEFTKVDRAGRIFIDTGRNGYSATFAAPYAVRAKPGAPVSAPCTWDELASGAVAPQTLTLRSMAARVEQAGDLWAGIHDHGQSLGAPTEQLREMLPADEWVEDFEALQSARRVTAMREGRARRQERRPPKRTP
jgi:bifunctional non-homologous end joining protein LigD